eukprot:6423504-Ditylum_brightwellii.AAC.1
MDKLYFLTWKTDIDLGNYLPQLGTFLEEEEDFLGDIGCKGDDDDQIEDDDEVVLDSDNDDEDIPMATKPSMIK